MILSCLLSIDDDDDGETEKMWITVFTDICGYMCSSSFVKVEIVKLLKDLNKKITDVVMIFRPGRERRNRGGLFCSAMFPVSVLIFNLYNW